MPITSRFVVRSTIGLLAVGFLTLFCIVGMTIWLGERAQVYFDDVIQARDVRGSAVELRDAMRTAESSQRGYLFTGNEIYLAPYDSAKTLMRRQLDALTTILAPHEGSAPMIRRLTNVVDEKMHEMDQTIGLKTERKDADAVALIRTNRGKYLMDEANVFLYGIILSADERLTAGVSEQRANAAMLRWVSIFGAIVIILVVGGVIITVLRYAREISIARDEVTVLNANLEERVSERTADLVRSRDRAEVLLTEVNHRVANSLALVVSLIKLQSTAVSDQAAKNALSETQGRIYAISLIHKRLYSSGDVRFVVLDEYLSGLLEHLETSMHAEGYGATLRHSIDPMKLATDTCVNLGVVVTEWVTNAFKYAYPDHTGEVRVRVAATSGGRAELLVEDDGAGRGNNPSIKGTGLGTRIVNAMAVTMRAEIEYLKKERGTSARMRFSLPPA
jgi:two-component sensor histidine kinase